MITIPLKRSIVLDPMLKSACRDVGESTDGSGDINVGLLLDVDRLSDSVISLAFSVRMHQIPECECYTLDCKKYDKTLSPLLVI